VARRVIDGPSIYNESWDSPTRDVFLWLLTVGADSYGLQRERPRRISEATGLPLRRVAAALDALAGQEVILRYADGETVYLVFRRWQDFQRVLYTGRPSCILPPPEILAKLSQETRELFVKSSEKFPRSVAVAVAVADVVAVAVAVSPPSRTSRKAAPGACGWCTKPKGPDAPEVHRLLQSCHDSYRVKHGRCPTLVPNRDGAVLKRLLAAGHGPERLQAVWGHYLGSSAKFAVETGYDIPTFGRLFDGVALALDQGEAHGVNQPVRGPGARRRLPSPASSFGPGGLVKL
jgi:hypothetical protein